MTLTETESATESGGGLADDVCAGTSVRTVVTSSCREHGRWFAAPALARALRRTLTFSLSALYFPYQLISCSGKYQEAHVAVLTDDERLDDTFAALANSTRRAIVARLAQGAANVNELAEPFDLTLPAISKHIKVLERAGLVVRSQRAQFRPCTLDATPLAEVSSWAEQYRPVWEARFDRMDDYLKRLRPRRQTERTR